MKRSEINQILRDAKEFLREKNSCCLRGHIGQ